MFEIKKLPDSEIEMNFEIPAEEFEKYYKEAETEILKSVSLPGFRPGKVPEKLAKEKIREEEVLKEAAERAVRATYFSAIEERKIDAISRPEITITKIARGDSFCYRVHTAIFPEITLSDYKKIAQDIKNKKKEESSVSAETNTKGKDGESEDDKERRKKLEEMKRKQKIQMEILEAIANDSEMEIPGVMIEAECEKMLGELRSSIENMGLKWEDYLGHLKKSDSELKKDWRPDALRRVKYGLILRELAEKENIQVSKEEIEKDVDEIIKQRPDLDREYLRSYTYGIIRNEKVFKFLEEV